MAQAGTLQAVRVGVIGKLLMAVHQLNNGLWFALAFQTS